MSTVFFIGGGNMAAAIIGGLDTSRWRIIVCEVVAERRKELESKFRVETTASVTDAKIKEADIIVFAVKPQNITEVLEEMKPLDLSGKVVVSIMAGIPLAVLQKGLNGKDIKFVRTMPNTPLMVSKGVTGIYTTDNDAKRLIADLLSSTSKLFFVNEEGDLDKVCAISGSGPAYFFAFMEALRDAGEKIGLKREDATAMAIGTCLGAATLAANSEEDISKLRQNVTSKGGTTEQALLVFEKNDLNKIVATAVEAALCRGREIAQQYSSKL